MSRPQKGKNRKRPRAWHRGVTAGRDQARDLARIEQAETAAAAQAAEVASARAAHRDDVAVWRALAHIAPFVPRLEARL